MFILVILVNVAAFEPPLESSRYFDTMAKCEKVQKKLLLFRNRQKLEDRLKIKIKCTLVS